MRILMAHWTLQRGGAEVVMCALSRHFRKHGHAVDFVTTVTPGAHSAEFGGACDELWHCGRSSYESNEAYLSRFGKAILRREYDVLMTHHSLQAVAVAGLLPTSVSTVSVVHEHPLKGSGHVALQNRDAFDNYVGVSRGVAEAAQGLLGPGANVICIPNGVEPGSNPPRQPSGHLRTIYAGRLVERQKRISMLPQIARSARELGIPFRLEVIGEGEDVGALKAAVTSARVSDLVSLSGGLTQAEVFDRMEAADVLFLCSRQEGLALVILEAMSRGCVPIASDLKESTAEVITSGYDGFLVPGDDPAAYASALEKLWKAPDLLDEMRANACSTAWTRFSLDRMLIDYDNLLEHLRRLPSERPRSHNRAVSAML